MRRNKQQKTNILNLICHIEIPVSVARQWWCNNVVWWWLEFGMKKVKSVNVKFLV